MPPEQLNVNEFAVALDVAPAVTIDAEHVAVAITVNGITIL